MTETVGNLYVVETVPPFSVSARDSVVKEALSSAISKSCLLVKVTVFGSQGKRRKPLSLNMPAILSVSSWTAAATPRQVSCKDVQMASGLRVLCCSFS